ncbi:MBL fold metallo-hydrolase [Amycolatopsis acidiphila]|uniref:MBL fold metallo-hydrolase n=1 Tax=Amycolatopsis acidiphila TaxID=715473 RepID=A0A557ZWG6_9PSEU|nr:MBL fold metallo-hydrolase [Amycolatopsis acidiphila]TVT16328.1 MBL fold metallo-hydrolase [Amycolatopsis acidiphila]UIJ61211.1 MBL fold metallo-hydrolase [Amycolatopsis acidiphila]GHG97791.1 MBL fold metallo-hydrolase [Amycolatopsis acidiphila]
MTTFTRRGLFGASAGAAAVLAGALPAAAAQGNGVSLRWWGNNGWEIRLPGGRTVLIDPWLTRFRTGTYTPAGADPKTPISVDTALIDRYVDSGELRADHILVTHGHYDHLTDVPYLARKTGATVLGTETHLNLLAALGAPEGQLSLATGGEYLDFGSYTIRVLRALHSESGSRATVAFPGTRPGFGLTKPPVPTEIRHLVEGGTLAYEVAGGGVSVLDFGGSNYVESELAGLRPDVVLMPVGGGSIHEYAARLLRTVGFPRYVLPTHWDDFDYPLDEPARDWGGLAALRTAVAQASPSSRFAVVDHLQTFVP